MNTNATLLATVALALALVAPTTLAAGGDGNLARSFAETNVLLLDFKDGAGIHDPADENNPCTFLLLGARQSTPTATYYDGLGVTTNYNQEVTAIGTLGQSPDGIDTGIACPIPGSPLTTLHIKWSGMNAESWQGLSNDILLCGDLALALGCSPVPGSQDVQGTACEWDKAVFDTASISDLNGSTLGLLGSRSIDCDDNQDGSLGDWSHSGSTSHNYTSMYTEFGDGSASTGFDIIKVEDMVHNGAGTSYAVVCVAIDYLVLDNQPEAPRTAEAHDYKLVLDLGDSGAPVEYVNALANHLASNVQGVYDLGGDNGFPCPDLTGDHDKKPAPLPGTE